MAINRLTRSIAHLVEADGFLIMLLDFPTQAPKFLIMAMDLLIVAVDLSY